MVILTDVKKYKIASVKNEVSDIKIFKMTPIEDELLSYLPGQFVFIHILDEYGQSIVKRPYSIASAPHMPYLEFCIKMVDGKLTSRLDKMGESEVIGIEGPFGHFSYNKEEKGAFIAGGTGIAPFIGMLRHIRKNTIEGKFVLFYSSRNIKNIIYREELEELKNDPNIKIVITLTRENPQGWKGEKGRIRREILCKHIQDAKEFHWWLCGPLEMIKSLKNCLLEEGAEPDKIKMEGWG